MAKSRGRRRKRYSPDDPLRLAGGVHVEELGPERDGWLPRMMETVVSFIPAFDASSEGRFKSAVIKIGLGLLAITLVTAKDEHWVVAVLGVALALLILFVPLGDTQKVRLQARLKKLRQPKSTVHAREGRLYFDGSKLSLKTQGRTIQSLRPFGDEPAKLGLFEQDSQAFLSLSRGKGKKRKELWVRAPVPDWEEWQKKPKPGRIPSSLETFDLSSGDFVTLVQAFTGR